jgi:hypothetical protein
MNERIDKLFEQALEEFTAENKYATIIVPNPLKEKFAELIVKECLQVINQPNGVGDDDVIRISDDVKQHFGVEE